MDDGRDRNWLDILQYTNCKLIQLYKMKSEQVLVNVWGVWLSFSTGKKQQASYETNLLKLHELRSWADLAYTWTQSSINNPQHYFANPATGQFTKFQIANQMRKIQSINFFKLPIEPTWQYGNNSKGGYFNFTLPLQTDPEIVQKIYESLIFMALGQSYKISSNLIGVRIIDTSAKQRCRCRFQIWVDYQESDDNLQMIKNHAQQIRDIIQKLGIQFNKIKFFNIQGKLQNIDKSQKMGPNDIKQ